MIRPAALLTIATLLLAACDNIDTATSEPGAIDRINHGEVVLVASAPDGTQLWAVRPARGARLVYFASSGTATTHTETRGKNNRATVDDWVPTAAPASDPLAGAAR